jgi:hypothetical protein
MSKANEALKIFYLEGLRVQLNQSNPFLSIIDRDATSVVGAEIRMALRYGRQGGIGNRGDDAVLPTPNSRQIKQARWGTKNIFARIHISDKTVKASKSNVGSFVSLLEAELEDAKTDATDSLARQVFGDGRGVLTTTKANTNTTTLQVNNAMYLAEGRLIDISSSAGVIKASAREILQVDEDGLSIVIDGANVTTTDTDIITIAGNYGEELTGLEAVFTPNTTLYGINRNENKWFNPTIKALSSGTTTNPTNIISEILIQSMIDECDRTVGGKVDFLQTSYGVRRAYQNIMLASKRIVEPMELEGGYKVLTYNGMPMAVDKYNPKGVMYGIDKGTWKLYHIEDWTWLDEDGDVLHRVNDRPVWEATLVRYCDIGCSKPKGNFKISNIAEM